MTVPITAYQAIFDGIPYVSCILAGIAVLSLALQKRAIIARSIAFSFQFWIAPLFYLTYMAIAQRASAVVAVAFCLELLFLAIYQILFRRLFAAVSAVSPQQLPKMLYYLKAGTWLIAILVVPLYFQSGAGIFSSGSRNDFLEGSRLSMYLIYASMLVQYALTPIVAAVINVEKRWSAPVILYLALISALSVIAGSKGGVLLIMAAIASLLKFERTRDAVRLLLVPVCAAAVLFAGTVFVVGKFLSLKPWQMVSLMFARLFLTNDCRALSIDWSRYLGHDAASLFGESFRLYATLIGNPPQFPPLGALLYTIQFGTAGMQGANTSSTALLIAYGGDIEKICFVLLLAGVAFVTGFLADTPGRNRLPRLAIGIGLVSLLSQDFLAFQISINILVLLCLAIIVKTLLAKTLRLLRDPREFTHGLPTNFV